MEAGKKKIVLQVVIFVVTFAIAFLGTQYIMSSFNSSVDAELKKAAVEMNKECPKMLDEQTRLDSASIFKNTFQYHYTLVHFLKGDPNLEIEKLKTTTQKSAQENLDTNPAMIHFREKKVALKYSYKDQKGQDLFDFTINATTKE